MAPLFGAFLLSAAGSLPLHLLPLLVAASLQDGRVSISHAGWIGSAYMAGQLVASIALPALGIRAVRARHALGSIALLGTCIVISAFTGFEATLACWFVAGTVCAVLLYWGTAQAALQDKKQFAFSLRLTITLVLAGLVIGGLQLFGTTASYSSLAIGMAIVLALVAGVGIALYRPFDPQALPDPAVDVSARPHTWLGVLIIYILFTGQVGFWAYAVQIAIDAGIRSSDASWAISLSKVLAGVALLALAYRYRSETARREMLVPGIVLAGGVLVASLPFSLVVFALGVLCWESGLNVLSARLQAKAIGANPGQDSIWITAAILFGGATGPALQGLAIARGFELMFVVFAIASALIPAVWERIATRTRVILP